MENGKMYLYNLTVTQQRKKFDIKSCKIWRLGCSTVKQA